MQRYYVNLNNTHDLLFFTCSSVNWFFTFISRGQSFNVILLLRMSAKYTLLYEINGKKLNSENYTVFLEKKFIRL